MVVVEGASVTSVRTVSAEFDLLCLMVRPRQDLPRVRERIAAGVDFEILFELASAHSVRPMLLLAIAALSLSGERRNRQKKHRPDAMGARQLKKDFKVDAGRNPFANPRQIGTRAYHQAQQIELSAHGSDARHRRPFNHNHIIEESLRLRRRTMRES